MKNIISIVPSEDSMILSKDEKRYGSSNANSIPYWNKYTLTIQEASEYFRIGEKKLRKLVDDDKDANYILWNGNRPQIKRILFEKYVDELKVI